MNVKSKSFLIICFLFILLLVMAAGALDSVKRGSGFLLFPSFTPSATMTATPSHTPTETSTMTATMTATETSTTTSTYTVTPSLTFTPTITATDTAVPTSTVTEVPTYDITALAEEIYAEVTAEVEAYFYSLTPSPTPIMADNELYTGLRMINPIDNKELVFISTEDDPGKYGFWMNWNEISNEEYRICVESGYCSELQSDSCSGKRYYSNAEYKDYAVVNITRGQAFAYCSWAGMQLMALEDWNKASAVLEINNANIDGIRDLPAANGTESSNIIGNVWEWTSSDDESGFAVIAGGSWKTSVQDIRANRTAKMPLNSYAEDIGFRCVSYVYKNQ